MWFVFWRRDEKPDAAGWPARRLLAALDALAWPVAGIAACTALPLRTGVCGAVWVAVCVLAAAHRLRRALWLNHRYRFTTWRWGRAAILLVVAGLLIRCAAGL